VSRAELDAYLAGRIDSLKIRRAEEREKRERGRNYSERLAFYGVRPRGTWITVVCVGAIGVAVGLAWLVTTEAAAALGLTLSLSLMGLATYLSTRQ